MNDYSDPSGHPNPRLRLQRPSSYPVYFREAHPNYSASQSISNSTSRTSVQWSAPDPIALHRATEGINVTRIDPSVTGLESITPEDEKLFDWKWITAVNHRRGAQQQDPLIVEQCQFGYRPSFWEFVDTQGISHPRYEFVVDDELRYITPHKLEKTLATHRRTDPDVNVVVSEANGTFVFVSSLRKDTLAGLTSFVDLSTQLIEGILYQSQDGQNWTASLLGPEYDSAPRSIPLLLTKSQIDTMTSRIRQSFEHSLVPGDAFQALASVCMSPITHPLAPVQLYNRQGRGGRAIPSSTYRSNPPNEIGPTLDSIYTNSNYPNDRNTAVALSTVSTTSIGQCHGDIVSIPPLSGTARARLDAVDSSSGLSYSTTPSTSDASVARISTIIHSSNTNNEGVEHDHNASIRAQLSHRSSAEMTNVAAPNMTPTNQEGDEGEREFQIELGIALLPVDPTQGIAFPLGHSGDFNPFLSQALLQQQGTVSDALNDVLLNGVMSSIRRYPEDLARTNPSDRDDHGERCTIAEYSRELAGRISQLDRFSSLPETSPPPLESVSSEPLAQPPPLNIDSLDFEPILAYESSTVGVDASEQSMTVEVEGCAQHDSRLTECQSDHANVDVTIDNHNPADSSDKKDVETFQRLNSPERDLALEDPPIGNARSVISPRHQLIYGSGERSDLLSPPNACSRNRRPSADTPVSRPAPLRRSSSTVSSTSSSTDSLSSQTPSSSSSSHTSTSPRTGRQRSSSSGNNDDLGSLPSPSLEVSDDLTDIEINTPKKNDNKSKHASNSSRHHDNRTSRCSDRMRGHPALKDSFATPHQMRRNSDAAIPSYALHLSDATPAICNRRHSSNRRLIGLLESCRNDDTLSLERVLGLPLKTAQRWNEDSDSSFIADPIKWRRFVATHDWGSVASSSDGDLSEETPNRPKCDSFDQAWADDRLESEAELVAYIEHRQESPSQPSTSSVSSSDTRSFSDVLPASSTRTQSSDISSPCAASSTSTTCPRLTRRTAFCIASERGSTATLAPTA